MSKEIVDRLMALHDEAAARCCLYDKASISNASNNQLDELATRRDAAVAALRAALEAAFAQEPVAWRTQSHNVAGIPRYHYNEAGDGTPLYAAPQPAADAQKQVADHPLVNDTFAVDWLTNRAPLHPLTANLVVRFARALAQKLAAAEQKYGYTDGWREAGWMDECRAKLAEHVAKGDPRDVAAYCAFLWHNGESTAPQPAADAPSFDEAWARKVAAGYQYGEHELENVRMGFNMALEMIAQPAADAQPATCSWWQEDEDSEIYETSCRNMYTLTGDPPHDWMKFCCYCGKPAKVEQWEPEASDDDAAIAAAKEKL